MATSVAIAAPSAADFAALRGADPGAQLQRAQEYMERERIAREIEENKLKNRDNLVSQPSGTVENADAQGAFELKELKVDASKVLAPEEIKAITSNYEGKSITLQGLYEIANKINALYTKKGYITCKAFVPPQRVKSGVVRIGLLEGATGQVKVVGNKHTKEGYIKKRLPLKNKEIMNINDLNKGLLRYNGTNDMQLHIVMEAGTEPGTTDYIIQAFEPKNQTLSLYSDNQGSETSGQWRQGLFYNNRSLTGVRDNLSLSLMRSQGTKALSTGYSRQLGHSGTKLNFGFSTNTVKIVNGPMENLGVKGHASTVNLGVTQPLVTTKKTKATVGMELGHHQSNTKFSNIDWVDDTIDDISMNYTLTNYGNSHIFYQKHALNYAIAEGIDRYDLKNMHKIMETKHVSRYLFDGLYQKGYKHGNMINARLEFQWSPDDYLPSARQFFIGGMNSVRGYKESLLSGDSGVNYSIEYSVPVFNKATQAYVFTDGGYCFGESAFDDNALYSVGLGIRTTYKNRIYGNLALGIPLVKDLNGKNYDSFRVHFMLNAQL